MKELVDFLNARYDEREAKARAAMHGGEGRWHPVDPVRQPGRIVDERGEVIVYDEWAPNEDQAEHIAANDPDFVLWDVEAKRQIIARYVRQAAKQHESAMQEDRAWTLEPVLFDLALPFANHPDYKPEWKP